MFFYELCSGTNTTRGWEAKRFLLFSVFSRLKVTSLICVDLSASEKQCSGSDFKAGKSNWGGGFVTVTCSGLLVSIVRGGKIILSTSIPNSSMSLQKCLRHVPVFYLSFLQVLLLKTFKRCLKSRPVFVSNVMCSQMCSYLLICRYRMLIFLHSTK